MLTADPFPFVDLALRAGIASLMLFGAALLLRDHARSLTARLGAACGLGVAAYALCALPGFVAQPAGWKLPLVALSTGNAVVFWLFSRALFDDDFEPRPWHAGAWAGLALLGIANCFALPSGSSAARALGAGITFATLGFSALAVAQSLATWRSDLVEKRRRLRVFIVGGGAAYTLVTTLTRWVGQAQGAAGLASLLDALALGALVVTVVWHLLGSARSGLFALAVPAATTVPESAHPPEPAAEPDSEPPDPRLLAALDRLMTSERIYREEGLTIGALAARLDVPEYKARRLINRGLGHRNFNAFVNRYRLDEAKRALADPARAELPVLSIALDAGFQSIGPFNRAFKADTGITPSEYRRLGGQLPRQDAALRLADSELA